MLCATQRAILLIATRTDGAVELPEHSQAQAIIELSKQAPEPHRAAGRVLGD